MADAASAIADQQQVRSVAHPAVAIGRRADAVVGVAVEEIPRAEEQPRQILAHVPAAIAVALGIAVTRRPDLRVLAPAIAEPAAARRRAALPLDLSLNLRPRLSLILRAALGLIAPLSLLLGLALRLGLRLLLGLALGLRLSLDLRLALGLLLRLALRLGGSIALPLLPLALLPLALLAAAPCVIVFGIGPGEAARQGCGR